MNRITHIIFLYSLFRQCYTFLLDVKAKPEVIFLEDSSSCISLRSKKVIPVFVSLPVLSILVHNDIFYLPLSPLYHSQCL